MTIFLTLSKFGTTGPMSLISVNIGSVRMIEPRDAGGSTLTFDVSHKIMVQQTPEEILRQYAQVTGGLPLDR